LLGPFREREPDIEVELEVANRSRIWDILAHWGADVVLAGRPPVSIAATTMATRPNALVVVGRSDAPGVAGRLAEATWLMREAGSGTRATTEELFALLGIAPPQITVGSNGAIRECVRAGLGIALLPREAVERDLAEGAIAIVPTPETPLHRDWHLVTSAAHPPSSAALRFVAHAVRLELFEPMPAAHPGSMLYSDPR
jgi:DNA-binding transcriptional LysR family regulator